MQLQKYAQWFVEKRKCMFAIMAVILLVSYITYFFYLDTFVDHPYYVGCSRLIVEGKYPFTDYNPGYPPLIFYIVSLILRICPDTVYTHLTILYTFLAADTFLLYKLLRKANASTSLAIICILYFLFLAIKSDATAYVLEPFILFFGLSAILAVQSPYKRMLFLSGILAMCATWCKQYGIGFICLCLLYPVVNQQSSIKHKITALSLIILGTIVAFFAVFGICQLHGAEFSDLSMLSGNDYERKGFMSLINGFFKLCANAHILYACLIVIPYIFRTLTKKPMAWVCIAAIVGFWLQCYVRNFRHYMILALPFIVLLIPIILNSMKTQKAKTIFLSLLCLSMFAKSIEICCKDISAIRKDLRSKEMRIAQELEDIIPYGTENVFVSLGAMQCTTYNYYKPSLLQKYGLSNGFVADAETTNEYLRTCNWAVFYSEDLKDTTTINEESLMILDSLYTLTKEVTVEKDHPTLVYKRNHQISNAIKK